MVKNKHPDILGTREKEVKEKKEHNIAKIRMARLYQKTFGTVWGKEVFNDMMEFCMVFQTTMTGNSYTYFNEGKRACGLHYLEMREQGWEREIMLRREEHLKILTPKTEEE